MELTPDEQCLTSADAVLDQLIASVRDRFNNPSAHKVRLLHMAMTLRPPGRTAEEHVDALACNLALALYRLASQTVDVPE